MHNRNNFKRKLFFAILFQLIFVNAALATTISIELSINLPEQDKQNIKENLSLYQYRESPILDKDYVNSLKTKGVGEIQTMLQTFGYYKSKVSVSSEQQNDNLIVKYFVDLGPPVLVNSVNIQLMGDAEHDPEILIWVDTFPLKKGDILSQAKYEEAKKSLLQLLHNRGYFSSKLDAHKILVDLTTMSASIKLMVDGGPRYFFGQTYFVQENYDPGFLSRFVPYSVGDVYNAESIVELQRRFLKSQEFLSVEINPDIAAAKDLQVPITVRLVPKKKWRFSFGAGYSTDIGPYATAAITKRRFTRRGHQVGADTMLSETTKQAQLNYRIPAQKPWSDYYNISYQFTEEDTDETTRYTNSYTVKSLYEWKVFRNIISLKYDDERYVIGNELSDRSQLFVPSFAIQYSPEKNSVLNHLDFDLYTEFRGATEEFASDVSFTQFITRGNLKYKLLDNWQAVSRFSTAFTDIADFRKLPVSYRFYAGGDYSVRGYKYHSLAPTDEDGNFGGRNLLEGSLEMRYRFLEHWDASAFYDIGNAFNIGNTALKKGAGVGIGWLYSLISVRFYAANALSSPDRPWRLHILVGANL